MTHEEDRAAERPQRDAAIYATVHALGATSARVTFSGGNDEGGADEIALYDGDRRIEHEPDLDLWQQLADPIHDEFGGFAGGYRVAGELRIDAASQTMSLVTLEGADDYRAHCEAEAEGYREWLASAQDPAPATPDPKPSLVARLFGRR